MFKISIAYKFGSIFNGISQFLNIRALSVSTIQLKAFKTHKIPEQWLTYNDVVYPPQTDIKEPRRPAEIVHQRANIKYSQKKLWYVACMIRGLSVDEALKQLAFYIRKGKGVQAVSEVIKEAQEMAVNEHNVEFKSNLWIEDSFVRKAKTIKGQRIHARRNPGTIHYRYSHYFIRLKEGRPPQHYYPPPATTAQILHEHLLKLRERQISKAL